ncbi:MAG: sigma-70 family RNA polymerase sigma factor [Polyangiaceae bacterium]|nr:sigma-70 family RNA polymerase sigma factor [Polyangiaceae bacterium]
MTVAPRPTADSTVLGLLERTLAGDVAAERSLSESLLLPTIDAAVSKYLFGRAKRFFEREDLVQEVFEYLYRDHWHKLRLFDPNRGTLEAFVFEVARSWIRDHSRKTPPPTPDSELDEHAVPDSGPEAALGFSRTVAAVLNSLDAEEVMLFRWLYLERVERAEIAARTHLSMDATYKRIQRMEAKVKRALSAPEAGVDSAAAGADRRTAAPRPSRGVSPTTGEPL